MRVPSAHECLTHARIPLSVLASRDSVERVLALSKWSDVFYAVQGQTSSANLTEVFATASSCISQ